MFGALLKPVMAKVHPVLIEHVQSKGAKEARMADVLEPVLNSHRPVVDFAVIKQDASAEPKRQLFYQMSRPTRDRGALAHDDRLDALTMAVAYWVEAMARDIEQAADENKEALLKADLETFMAQVVGSRGRGSETWLPEW